uniref:DALR anticodon binding domain containing 3 n=1 Tax=Oncorhynchus kisutch TaxID=8019 RepID=A0A8C7KZY7_ONCKI
VMENIEETPFRITHSALRGEPENVPDANGLGSGDRISSEPEKLWFKESSAKNLLNRDLSPTTVLNTLYADGQVPPAVMVRVQSLRGTGVLPVAGGELIGEGLRVWVDRTAAFQKVLSDVSVYLKPPCQRQGYVVLNCPALHPKPNVPSPDTLTLGQLRNVLLTDHLGEALQNSPYREREETDGGRRESKGKNTDGDKEEMLRVNLKRVFQEEQLPGYDPSLGSCTGETNNIDLLTRGLVVSTATAVHVTSCQDEFRQQQIAMLWRASGATVTQGHLVCGPLKTPGTHLSAAQYLQLRRVQMKEASETKYGEQVEDQTWDDIIKVMTSATVRFELLSTVHTSPVSLWSCLRDSLLGASLHARMHTPIISYWGPIYHKYITDKGFNNLHTHYMFKFLNVSISYTYKSNGFK